MPREQSREIRSRPSMPEGKRKSTTFKPQASPTDPLGINLSPGAQDFAQSLKAVLGLGEAAGAVGEIWAEEETKAGAQARAQGKPRPEDASQAFIAGFETMDGKHKAIAYKTELADYTERNKHLSPDEFKGGLDELQQKHLGTLYHDKQLDAFLPDAFQAEEWAWGEFQKQKRQEVQAELVSKTQTILRNENMEATREGLAVLGMKGFEDLTTSDNLRKLADNAEGVRGVWGPKLRAVLTKNQEEGASLMPKQDWTERMFEATAADAIRYGAPELMAWMHVKDKSGIVAADTMDRQGNSYNQRAASVIRQAEANRYTLLQRYEADEKEAKKERSGMESNDMLDRIIASSADPTAMAQIRAEFATKKEWLTGDKRAINSLLMAFEQDGTHPINSTDEAYLALHRLELTGKLSTSDVESRSSQLSREDYRGWLGKVVEVRKYNRSRTGENQIYFDPKKIAELNYREISNAVNPKEFGMAIDPEGERKEREAQDMFTRLMVEFQQKNGRAAEYTEVRDLMKKVYEGYPPVDKAKLYQKLLNGETTSSSPAPKTVQEFMEGVKAGKYSPTERLKYSKQFQADLSKTQQPKEE